MARHPAHHGHMQAAPSSQHAKRHDAQMASINKHQTARNNGRDGSTADVGGSMRMSDPGPKGKSPAMQNEMPAFRKVTSGRPDTASGKTVS